MDPHTPIHAAKVGRWISDAGKPVDLTAAILSDLVASYDPSVQQAPIVIGHPQAADPAWGWIAGAMFDGESLWLTPERVETGLVDMVQSGRYQAVSISMWPPSGPGNPKPGHYYLRHLGFLGASVPAVQGLTPYQFSACADALVAVINLSSETSMSEQEKAALEQQKAKLDLREKTIAAREAALRRAETLQFAQGLAEQGRILPRHAEQLTDVLIAMPVEAVINFSSGAGAKVEQKSAAEVLRTIFSELPALPLGEKTAAADEAAPVSFSAPTGVEVSTSRLDLHHKAVAWQAAHPGSTYVDAARAVGA